ncbi:type II toxin-antitoxin system antitoxin HigA [soil metagenome]
MTPQTKPLLSAFDEYLAERLQNPAVRAGFEDQSVTERLIDQLVGFRKALGLTQTEVAKRMGVGQSTVSGFETETSDPRISTLQRYARAVEARLEAKIHWEAACDWVESADRASGYKRTSVRTVEVSSSPVSPTAVTQWAREVDRSSRDNFVLSA